MVEILKIIENCTTCKHKRKEYHFDISYNEIEYYLIKLEKEEIEWRKKDIIKTNEFMTAKELLSLEKSKQSDDLSR